MRLTLFRVQMRETEMVEKSQNVPNLHHNDQVCEHHLTIWQQPGVILHMVTRGFRILLGSGQLSCRK